MTAAALREALQQWVRHPSEMALANVAAFTALFLPAAALRALPGPLQGPALLPLAAWAWLVFSALCAACAQLALGTLHPWRGTLLWLRGAWRERLAAWALGAIFAAWTAAAAAFYRSLGPPALLGLPLAGVLGSFALWLALALLLSFGVSAEGGRTFRGQWKAAALLPLAYAPSALAAGAVFAAALGLAAFWVGLDRWSARLLLLPLLMSPFFTLSFLAAYVTALVRGMFDRSQGLPPAEGASWRELWSPWR